MIIRGLQLPDTIRPRLSRAAVLEQLEPIQTSLSSLLIERSRGWVFGKRKNENLETSAAVYALEDEDETPDLQASGIHLGYMLYFLDRTSDAFEVLHSINDWIVEQQLDADGANGPLECDPLFVGGLWLSHDPKLGSAKLPEAREWFVKCLHLRTHVRFRCVLELATGLTYHRQHLFGEAVDCYEKAKLIAPRELGSDDDNPDGVWTPELQLQLCIIDCQIANAKSELQHSAVLTRRGFAAFAGKEYWNWGADLR